MTLLTSLFDIHTFRPSDVPDLAVWLDASAPLTISTSGSNVTAWADRRNGFSFTPPAAGQRPSTGTVTKGFLNALDNDHAVGDMVRIADNTTIQNIFDGGGYIAMVVRILSDGGSNTGRILDKSGTNTGWFLDFREETTGSVKFNFKSEFDTTRYVGRSTTADITVADWHLIEFDYDNGNVANVVNSLVDGATETISTAVTPVGTRVSDAAAQLAIGGMSTGGTGVSADSFIGEILIYNSIPNSQEREGIRGYLNFKWNIY